MKEITDIRLVTTNKKKKKLVPEPNYHTTRWFSESIIYAFKY